MLHSMGANLGFLAILGVIAASWGQVKNVFTQFTRIFLVKYELTGYFELAFPLYLHRTGSEFSRLGSGLRRFGTKSLRSIKTNGYRFFIFEQFTSEASVYWKGIRPILLTKGKDSKDSGECGRLTIQFIRFTFNIDKLLKTSLNYYDGLLHNGMSTGVHKRFFVRTYTGTFGQFNNKEENGPKTQNQYKKDFGPYSCSDGAEILMYDNYSDIGYVDNLEQLANLALSDDVMAEIRNIKIWRDNERWFKQHSIPWKQGILLQGPPGNAKTALARMLGKELDLPIMFFDLATMTNQDFIKVWREAVVDNAPAIALIEDIDSVFDGRTNVMKGGLTFDCLLNCLDGITCNDGILLIITTNDITKLDPALGILNGHKEISTRPGRIDKILFMGNPDKAGREKIANRILKGWEPMIPNIVEEGSNDSGAQFQHRCCTIALEKYWESLQADHLLQIKEPANLA